MLDQKETVSNGLWIKVLAVELEDVSGRQASSSEATGYFTRSDDVRMRWHCICYPLAARIY